MGYLSDSAIREKYDKAIDSFTYFDDFFMSIAFGNHIELTTYVLKIILKKKDLMIVSNITQKNEYNMFGRSARFDILAVDSQGCLYHIEIENDKYKADEMRASYYSAGLVYRNTERGEEKVIYKENYTIFFTDADYYKSGKPVYPIERFCKSEMIPFQDQTHILYVNGTYNNKEDEIGRLMHDMHCSRPEDMYSSLMADVMRMEKGIPERRQAMCWQIREIEELAEARGEHRGIEIGEARGEQRGIETGEARGEENAILKNIRYIMDGLKYTAQEAMNLLNIPEDIQEKYRTMI